MGKINVKYVRGNICVSKRFGINACNLKKSIPFGSYIGVAVVLAILVSLCCMVPTAK